MDLPLVNILHFHPQELVAGIVVVNSKQEVQHQGIYLAMEGAVSLQLSAKSVGLFEAFYNSLKVHITCRMWRVVTCPPGNRQTESQIDMTDNITFQQSDCRKETSVNIRRLSCKSMPLVRRGLTPLVFRVVRRNKYTNAPLGFGGSR